MDGNERVIDLLGRLREITGQRARAESELNLALEQVDAARHAVEEVAQERDALSEANKTLSRSLEASTRNGEQANAALQQCIDARSAEWETCHDMQAHYDKQIKVLTQRLFDKIGANVALKTDEANREKEIKDLIKGVVGDCPPEEWKQRYLTVVALTKRYNAGLMQDLSAAKNYGAQMEAQFSRMYVILTRAAEAPSPGHCQKVVLDGFAPIRSTIPKPKPQAPPIADDEAGGATTTAEAAAHWKHLWEQACEERNMFQNRMVALQAEMEKLQSLYDQCKNALETEREMAETRSKALLCAMEELKKQQSERTKERQRGDHAEDLVVEIILFYKDFGMRPAWEDKPENHWLQPKLTAKLKEKP